MRERLLAGSSFLTASIVGYISFELFSRLSRTTVNSCSRLALAPSIRVQTQPVVATKQIVHENAKQRSITQDIRSPTKHSPHKWVLQWRKSQATDVDHRLMAAGQTREKRRSFLAPLGRISGGFAKQRLAQLAQDGWT